MSKYLNVGKVVNTHGIRGEVRVISVTDFKVERYKVGNVLYFFATEQAWPVPLRVASHRTHKNFDLLTFENHPNVNDVEKYKGGMLKVKESDRTEELEENEYYYDQIIGCEVFTDEGVALGRVVEILSPGANDVWVVKPHQKGKDILLPYIADVVKEIDIAEKKVIVHILEGLL